MGHKHGDFAFAFENRARDLGRGQNQTARCVQHQIQRNFRIGQMNCAEYFFTIVNVDVAEHWKPEQAHRLLPMHEQNDARFPFALD